MLEQEIFIECPFCEKAKIKVRYKPSVIVKKRKVSATLGTKYNTQKSKEIYEVLEDCHECGKTKKDIEKRLIEGKPIDREKLIERIRALGLDPAKVRL